jgi:DNA replication protein DnaC
MRSASIPRCWPSPDTTATNRARWRWRAATKKAAWRAIRYVRESFFAARSFTDLDDLNVQAEAWCAGQAADRRCPAEPARTVREVFADEQSRLLALPDNPAPVHECVQVRVGKTPYVRFDLNDYSVPAAHVQRTLTVLADPHELRIVDGAKILACHRRSYDKGAQIEDPIHIQALVEQKRAARQHRATDRLIQAAPAARDLLVRAAERGGNLGALVVGLQRLLDRYGAAELQAAILEALVRDVPHPNAVRLALEQRRAQRGDAPPVAVELPAHVHRPAMCRCRRTPWRPMTSSRKLTMSETDILRERATALHLHGLVAHWPEAIKEPWLAALIDWEEQERTRRSLERRLRDAQIGRFKPLCDFDWNWPKSCDRAAVEAVMTLDFLNDASNAILIGPNGVGKTMIIQNIVHQALLAGHTALFTTAGRLLGDLAALDSDSALRRRLNHYARPTVLAIDEVGYLSYSNRHADLMFELISRRYRSKSTLVTTNRSFSEWKEVFPNAACVVSLIDRLTHYAEIIAIDGESYRVKEARERNEQRARQRRGRKP